tara:strand:- start:230 stop:6541 length:6312 start_codon:yes stop_codon:yes gene_type:complete
MSAIEDFFNRFKTTSNRNNRLDPYASLNEKKVFGDVVNKEEGIRAANLISKGVGKGLDSGIALVKGGYHAMTNPNLATSKNITEIPGLFTEEGRAKTLNRLFTGAQEVGSKYYPKPGDALTNYTSVTDPADKRLINATSFYADPFLAGSLAYKPTKAALTKGANALKKSVIKTGDRVENVFDPKMSPGYGAGSAGILTKLKKAQAKKNNFDVAKITKSQEFIDFAKDKFKQMTVDGVPPTRKAWGKEISITGDNSLNTLLKKPEFENLPFLSNKETYTKTFLDPKFRADSNKSMAVTNYNKALVRANETGGPVIYQPGKQRQIIFPENNVAIKEKFLLDLEKATKGKKGGDRKFTLNDMARKYNMGEGDFNQAIKNFKKEEGLLNDPKYNFEAPIFTGKGSTSERNKAISEWINNSNTKQVDKDIYKEANTLVSNYNSSNPDNKMNLDHIMGFINSKNKIDAQTIENLQITTEVFNKEIKAFLFEKTGSGFRLLDKEIKNTKDKVLKQNLIKVREDTFNDYVKTVENAGYFMDTTGLPFLPKKMQIDTKTTNGLRQHIDNLQNQLDNQIDSLLAEQTGYQSNFGYKKGGAVKPKRGLVDEPGGYAGLEETIGGTYLETLEEEKRKEKEEERKSLLAEQDEGTFITRSGLGIYEEIGKVTDRIEKTSESIMDEARERLNPSRPVKIKPSEILKLGESPLVKAPIALPWTVYNNLLRVTGDAYNAVSGKDLDVEKEFPYTFKMQEYITKSVGKTPDEQDYISFFDEVTRMQETGFTRLGFSIVDLAASIPDLVLDTNFTERVQEEYDKSIKNGTFSEPETFIGKIGAIAIEFGVPGGQAFKFANFLRRAFKGNRVANYLGKTKTGKYISDVAARVGTGATTFALTDFVAGGPYNTVSEEFAGNPLLFDEALNYKYENTEGLSGRDLVKANFKNRLRFGADGALVGGAFPIVGPPLWWATKNGLLKPLTVGGKIGGQQIPGVGSVGVQLVDQAFVQPATYLLSKTPGVSEAVGGVKMFGEFLGKDIMTRAAVKAMGANPGYIKQLPDFKDWRMFKVTSDDPLEANLKKIDNFFSYFRDSSKQTADEFYISKTTEQGIKAKSRDVEKHLDSIEVKAYELANKFKARYNTAKTSPAGEEKILEDVLDYLKGSIKLNQLPKEIQEIAKSLSKTFDDIKVSFKNELPKDGGGKLQELNTYLNTNLKQYIRQSFAAFTNPQFKPAPEAMESLVDFIKMQIKKDSLMVETAVRNSNLPREQAIESYARQNAKQLLQTVKAEGVDPIVQLQTIAKENLGLEDLKIKTGEEMPDVVKRFLGEEKDLRGQIMATTASLVTQSSNAKMYNDLTESMLQSGRLFDTKEAAMAAGVLNPQLVGKVKGLGMLEEVTDIASKYADPEIANVLRGSRGMLDTLMENGVYQGLIAYKAGVQTGKTVLSPATQGRNFISAGAFPLNMGHIGGKASLGDAIKITMDDIFGAGKIADETLLIKDVSRKIELGVLDENIVSSELTAVLNDIKSGKVSTLGQITNRVDNSKLMKTATRLYAGGDNVWKWYGHEYLKSQYKGVFKNLDEAKREFTRISGISPEYIKATNLHEAIEELSAHVLRETYPTYSKVPPVIQAIRKIPFIGNFVSFPAEIFRTSVATSASAMKNIASPNAQIRTMGYRTLMGQSLTLGGLNESIKATGHLMTDVSRDQVEIAKKEFLPEYMRNSQLVPITNIKDGKFKAFDLSRFLPYDIVSTTAANLMGQAVNMEGLDPQKIENDVLQEYFKAVGPMLDVLNGSFFGIAIGYEPAADLLFRGGRTKTGTAIYSDSDLMQEKIDKVMMHFANNAEPGALRTLQNLYNAAQGDVTGTGQPIEAKDEVFKMFGGSSVPIDILGGYGFKINEFQNTFKDARVSEGWYSPKDWRQRDGAQLAREYKNQNLEALREQYNFYRLSKKALESGLLTQKQIYPILAERLGKKTAARVLSGYFTPLSYGEGGLKRRYQNVKRGNPNEPIDLKEFMPLGKLEQIKGEFSTFKFSDFEKQIEGQEKAPSGSLQDLLNSQSSVTPPVQEPQVPPLPDTGTPVVSSQQTASVAGNTVSPRTGLTNSESVLLSPTDQLYRRKQRGLA